MLALRTVEHLDVVEDLLPCFFSGYVGSAPHTFALQVIEEVFGNGVVVAVSPAAHAVFEIVQHQDCVARRLQAWPPPMAFSRRQFSVAVTAVNGSHSLLLPTFPIEDWNS
jgi:hypothetical protein